MKVAYADPPYFGLGKLYKKHHPDAMACDSIDWHRELINRLCADYEAWAMSLHSPSLKHILPLCPADVRVMAWVKPFCSFKPGIGVAYAWEPVIVRGGRKRTRKQRTVRDWCDVNITLQKGLTGAKPPGFCGWLFEVLNLIPTDDFYDLFPGTGVVGREWEKFQQQNTERQLFLIPDSK